MENKTGQLFLAFIAIAFVALSVFLQVANVAQPWPMISAFAGLAFAGVYVFQRRKGTT